MDFGYIEKNLKDLCEEIRALAEKQGREVTLVAVTKSGSDEELCALVGAGVLDIGENRPGELRRRGDLLKEKGYSSTRLRKEKLLGESYMSQLRRGDMISWAALDMVCSLLQCQVGDLIEHVDTRVDKTAEGDQDL